MTITSSRPATPDSYVPSRRTVLRAAAWTAPAVSVAVAVPAFAACSTSTNVPGVVNWDGTTGTTFSRTADRRSASATYTRAGAAPITVTASTRLGSNQMQLGAEDRTYNMNFDRPAQVGGLVTPTGARIGGLCLHQSNRRSAPMADPYTDRVEYTFAFTRPVTNLSFYVTDIDAASGDFRDAIELTSGFSRLSIGSRVDGTGTRNDPYRADRAETGENNVTGGRGNVRVNYAGPISAFTLTYWNIATSFTTDTDQAAYISDLNFTYASADGCTPV